MNASALAHPAAEAAARVFKSLPSLRARPAERADLPDAALLRQAIATRGEFSDHYWWRGPAYAEVSCPWLRGALGTFGIEPAYFVALGNDGSPWWRIEPEDPINWLATLAQSNDDGASPGARHSPIASSHGKGVEDLTALSLDGARALLLQSWEDELVAFRVATRVLAHRGASGRKLLDLARDLDPVTNAVPTDPRERLRKAVSGVRAFGLARDFGGTPIEAEALRPGPRCRRRWSWDASSGERSTFFLEGLVALDATFTGKRSTTRYRVSTGAFGPLTWTTLADADPPTDWISILWDRGQLDRLFVLAHEAVLGFLATAVGIEGFLYDIEEVLCE